MHIFSIVPCALVTHNVCWKQVYCKLSEHVLEHKSILKLKMCFNKQVTLNENEEHLIVLHGNNFHSMFPLILHFFPCGPQAMILAW